MHPGKEKNHISAGNEAPETIEELRKLAFFAIMELTEEERGRVLSKYAERHGTSVEAG